MNEANRSALNDLPEGSPPLRQAREYGDNCAAVAFDWDESRDVVAKVREELGELLEAVEADHLDSIEDELGDLLFSIAQLARKLGVDPESALKRTNAKFARRFRKIEAKFDFRAERLREMGTAGLVEEWNRVKREERGQDGSGQPSSSSTPS